MNLSLRRRMVWILFASIALSTMFPGCTAHKMARVNLASLYNRSAQYHRPDRNPIIAIPGILGSKLTDASDGVTVWGAFEPAAADPGNPDGARRIALPIDSGVSLQFLRDTVESDGVLETLRVRILGVPVEILAYAGILATLGAGGYRDESLGLSGEIDYGDNHFTCFQFDYDWRRDNVENAQRLHEFILEKQEYVRREYRKRFGIDNPNIRFDIAAHSMGGLIARYFLMYGSQELPADGSLPQLSWEGASLVERVVLVGPPNAGSADALVQLVKGRKFGPFLPEYPPAILGTFPALYQLLPRSRHHAVVWDGDTDRPIEDLLDPQLWRRLGWGLSDPSQNAVLRQLMPETDKADRRRAIAADFQKKMLVRAKSFFRALDRTATSPPGLQMFLLAGDGHPTAKQVSVDSQNGRLRIIEKGPGDGSVLRASALMDERMGQGWKPRLQTPIDVSSVLFLPERHLEMTSSAVFRDNVLFWLLEDDR